MFELLGIVKNLKIKENNTEGSSANEILQETINCNICERNFNDNTISIKHVLSLHINEETNWKNICGNYDYSRST